MEAITNIAYKPKSSNRKHRLDIYTPDPFGSFPVLIFVHGGSWYNGCKEWYSQLGKHLADKKILSVIINYRLGDEANYEGMADDVAAAASWVVRNIHNYGGDVNRVFIGGHSAGGHLAALVTLNNRFTKPYHEEKLLKGCMLIDAFGLNMDYIMHNNNMFFVKEMQRVFTKDPLKWNDAAPVKYIVPGVPPFLVLTGSETYPYITMDNEVFKMNLTDKDVPFTDGIINGRNHMEMITCLQNPNDPMYEDLLGFMMKHSSVSARKV